MSGVHETKVPRGDRKLSTLCRIDYEDATVAPAVAAPDRTGEEWARAVLEGASPARRKTLDAGWSALGLRRGSTDDDRLVLGWEVRCSGPDFVLLGADSPLGLEGEVLFKCRNRTLLLATFIKLDNPAARALWAGIAPGHRLIVRRLLESA
jgi:hypothetical protein